MRKLVAVGTLVLTAALASGCATGIVNKPPSDVTGTSATVNGIVWTTDGGDVSYWVEYGTTTDYGQETAHQTAKVAEDTPHDVSIPLKGLTPATTWHYRLCAEDAQAATCSRDATLFTGDSVTGFAHECFEDPGCDFQPPRRPSGELSAFAHSGPTGEAPAGTMAFQEWVVDYAVGYLYQTGVSCLAVSGNTAIVGVAGTATQVRFSFRTWVAGHIRVTDGGGVGSRQDTFEFDLELGPFLPPPPLPWPAGPTDCSSFQGDGLVYSNQSGDLVVTDVDPLPSS
jgi:hypothetical protein